MKRYGYASLAALGFGLGPVLARYGAVHGMPSIIGTTFATALAIPFLFLVMRLRGKKLTFTAWPRRTLVYVLSTGLCSSLGVLFYWLALSKERVSVIVSINSGFPLITIALSFIFLRQEERITLKLLVGAVFLVGGVLIITV